MTQRSEADLDKTVIPPQLAGLILSVLEEQGVARNQVLRGSGIRPVMLDSEDSFLSYHQMMSLIENALAVAKTPWLGLLVGSRENLGTWGVFGYAMMSCSTYREAAKIGFRFYRAAPSLLLLSAEEEADRLRIHMDSPTSLGKLLPFLVEETVTGICTVTSILVSHQVTPLEIHVTYPKPEYAEKYDEFFPCPIHYQQSSNIFWCELPDDTPLQHSDPISARICRKLVDELLEKHTSEEDFLLEVRRILLRTPGRFPDMEAVAGELGMSSRTLRRKLGDLETTFQDILEDVRRNLALDYLQNSTLNLEEISTFLGYTEMTNFRRAFKQWTGKAPTAFRP